MTITSAVDPSRRGGGADPGTSRPDSLHQPPSRTTATSGRSELHRNRGRLPSLGTLSVPENGRQGGALPGGKPDPFRLHSDVTRDDHQWSRRQAVCHPVGP